MRFLLPLFIACVFLLPARSSADPADGRTRTYRPHSAWSADAPPRFARLLPSCGAPAAALVRTLATNIRQVTVRPEVLRLNGREAYQRLAPVTQTVPPALLAEKCFATNEADYCYYLYLQPWPDKPRMADLYYGRAVIGTSSDILCADWQRAIVRE